MRFIWLVFVAGCVLIGKDAHQDQIDAICEANPDDPDCEGGNPTLPPPTVVMVDCYADGDGDGFGTGEAVRQEESCPAGQVEADGDCDDAVAAVNPGADEICGDTVDDDCDGTAQSGVTAYEDADGDGFGAGDPEVQCALQSGYVLNSTDCDDASSAVYPGATEIVANGIDESCDGFESCPVDFDGDGVYTDSIIVNSDDLLCPAVVGDPDCQDSDPSIFPGAVEVTGDGIDQDCDGTESCYTDADDDDFGDGGASLQLTSAGLDCDAEDQLASVAGDCNDADETINPGAAEVCADPIDHDCSGDPGGASWYLDSDDDGYGDDATLDLSCQSPGTQYINVGGDCDDTEPSINPGEAEVVGQAGDEDCDGVELCYEDADEDGVGAAAVPGSSQCDQPFESTQGGDCDDTCDTCFPGGAEVCDGFDNDCSGSVDDGASDEISWYPDGDVDGYGELGSTAVLACNDPSDASQTYADQEGDCDDGNNLVNPGMAEICNNGIDDNCDPSDDAAGSSYWPDTDGDGFGAGTPVVDCSQPAGHVTNGDDCNDTEETAYPGAPRIVGDGIDNDCNGSEECYPDPDDDSYGGTSAPIVDGNASDCVGFAVVRGDCAPTNPAINPDATETPGNAIDEDCNGLRLCYIDGDDDGHGSDADLPEEVGVCAAGYAVFAGDCDDSDPDTHPGAQDLVGDAVDQDCDFDYACFVDNDGDSFSPGASVDQPTPCPMGVVVGDCDDTNVATNAGATEICDGLDNDCDQVVPADETDDDGDGYVECEPVAGSPIDGEDCDDTNSGVNPGQNELQGDDLDEDCDGQYSCYEDVDDDGFGVTAPVMTTVACTPAANAATNRDDCDDTERTVYPGAPALCDGIVNDCNSSILASTEIDNDGDSYVECSPWVGGGTTLGGDCDDIDAAVNPGAEELCDGIDSNCDQVDDAGVVNIGPLRYGTLQEAVDNAETGDVVRVCGGSSGGLGMHDLIASYPPSITIQGMAVGNPPVLVKQTGEVLLEVDSPLTLETLTLDGQQDPLPGHGGCLYAQEALVTLNTVAFTGCEATGMGGAIHLASGSSLVWNTGNASNNTADENGGVLACDGCERVTMSNVFLTENLALGSGGAVFVDAAANGFSWTNGEASDNIASSGGGFYILGTNPANMAGVAVRDNDATSNGAGGGRIELSTMDFNNCLFRANTAAGAGLALFVDNSDVYLKDSTAVDFHPSALFAAVTVREGYVEFDGANVENNGLGARILPDGSLDSRDTTWNNNPDVAYPGGTFNQVPLFPDFFCDDGGCVLQ